MKSLLLSIAFITSFVVNVSAQNNVVVDNYDIEKYGKTLNISAGLGYYRYVGRALPVVMLNYEFDVAKSLTLAPFIGIYTNKNNYYWGDPGKPYWDPSYRNYSYRETAIPLGVKATYYFDDLFDADPEWDFYAAGSLGFVYRSFVWDNNYYGNRNIYNSSSALYLQAHIGAEYHINQKTGLLLDLSTGVSTIGLAVHF